MNHVIILNKNLVHSTKNCIYTVYKAIYCLKIFETKKVFFNIHFMIFLNPCIVLHNFKKIISMYTFPSFNISFYPYQYIKFMRERVFSLLNVGQNKGSVGFYSFQTHGIMPGNNDYLENRVQDSQNPTLIQGCMIYKFFTHRILH